MLTLMIHLSFFLNLTLTLVVFECDIYGKTYLERCDLTLTLVVFEYNAGRQLRFIVVNLTLTLVVFEFYRIIQRLINVLI